MLYWCIFPSEVMIMKRIGIISAMWLEAELLHARMTDVNTEIHAGMTYYTGRIGHAEVVLSTCGIGKVNAAIFTQIMIDRFCVDAIIHTGIAGSMDDRAGHAAVIVADGLTYYDVRPLQLENCFPNRVIFPTDPELSRMLLTHAGADALQGLVITGDDFIADKARKAELKSRFPAALCVEMEGCAIANAAYVNGVPLAVVRCISDLADNAAAEDYSAFEQKAASRAAQIVLDTLADLS